MKFWHNAKNAFTTPPRVGAKKCIQINAFVDE